MSSIKKLQSWEGNYSSDSSSAVLFYSFMSVLWSSYLSEMESPLLKNQTQSSDNWKSLLREWLEVQKIESIYEVIKKSLPTVKKTSLKYPTWGDFTVQTQKNYFRSNTFYWLKI